MLGGLGPFLTLGLLTSGQPFRNTLRVAGRLTIRKVGTVAKQKKTIMVKKPKDQPTSD